MIREVIRTVIKNEITLSKLINDEEKKMTDSGATKDDSDNELYIDRNAVREIVKIPVVVSMPVARQKMDTILVP